jgi:transposase
VKSAERQAALLDHVAPQVRLWRNAGDFLVRQRTQTVNAIRAHLSEFGIVVAKGIHNLDRLLEAANDVPRSARPALDLLAGQLRCLKERIEAATARITTTQKADALARPLATIPGLGPIASSAFAATTPDVAAFRSARDYAAWLGLTPRAHSSGGKEKLGRISKAGNRYLRRLLYLGAMARISARRGRRIVAADRAPDWLDRMLARKPVKVVAVALAA